MGKRKIVALYKVVLIVLSSVTMVQSALNKPSGCGQDLGCYSDCESGTCNFVVTWKNNSEHVEFELSRNMDASEDQWIALGLSSDQKMGSDSVTDCITQGLTVTVQKSWNSDDKLNTVLTAATTGLQSTNGVIREGVLTCTYTQTKTSSNVQIANLNQEWYLLVARGKASNGYKLQHSVDPLPDVTPRKVNLLIHEDIQGDATYVLIKVHGSLMIFAWIFCTSIGIVLARYFEEMWPDKTVCKVQVWFAYHRPLMIMAMLSCCVAFIIIFIEVDGWSSLDDASSWQKWHPILGCIVTGFVVLNPLMALLRPAPDAKYRYIFNGAHFTVGTLAQLISVLVMVLGVTLAKASVPYYCVWILVAWAAYQVFMELMFVLTDSFKTKGSNYSDDGSQKPPRYSSLRKFMLALHVVIITGFTTACIVVVVLN